MKKYAYILMVCLCMTGCSNFLDTENLVQKDSSNFPTKSDDVVSVLTSAYAQNIQSVKGANWQIFPLIAEQMADYSVSGGGLGDLQARAIAEYKKTGSNMYSAIWGRYYTGVHRANFVIENAEKVKWANEDLKNQTLGEAYFLRSQFYFDLVRMFEKVPLIVTVKTDNIAQSEPTETFKVIFSDLVKAAELLPNVNFKNQPTTELGRATRWAAEGMIARAYLYFSGMYKQESIDLEDGKKLTKQDVIAYVDDCVANSGHDLISDFRNLWPYAVANKANEYKYANENNLEWIGEDGKNCETVFAYKFSSMGSANDMSACNNLCLFYGLRGQETMPFAKGWGWACVVPKFYDEWPDNDLRKKATIWNSNDKSEGVEYLWNKNRNYNETGYFNKKYLPVNLKNEKGKLVNYSCILYGVKPQFMYNNTQDIVILRFADILLMGAELGSAHAQEYMDRVRNRVGLESVPATLDNIKKERLYELAYEGVRYYDLMRWGEVEQAVNNMQQEVPVKIMGVAQKVTKKFRPASRGFLPIPEDQILLSNGVLKQNPGWEGTESIFLD